MAYAINRAQVSKIGEYGYEPASNQTDIVKPTFSSWYDSGLGGPVRQRLQLRSGQGDLDPEAAGYKRGSNGIFAKNGKPLSFTIINNGGFSDWVASVNVIQSELKAVGIQITPDNLSNTTLTVRHLHRQLPAGLRLGLAAGPTPYYELRAMLYSPNTAPIGKSAASNWERYSTQSTDALIEQYASTTSSAVQHQVVDELAAGHALGRAGDPGHRGGRLVPVRHPAHRRLGDPEQPVRAASQYAVPDWGVFCCTCTQVASAQVPAERRADAE